MLYLSYATGFLSGGFSETCATPTRCAYDPETNDNIELGYKADLLDNTLRLNAALYFTNYDDLQRAVVATYTAADGTSQQETVTVNTGSSEATGVDLEATWVPNDRWKVGAALNWLDHKYGSGSCLPNLRGDNPDPSSCDIDLTQFDLPFSPEWKFGVNVTRDFELSGGALVSLNGNLNYQSEAETDVFNGTEHADGRAHAARRRGHVPGAGRPLVGDAVRQQPHRRDLPDRGAAGGGALELHQLRHAASDRRAAEHEVRLRKARPDDES